MKKKTNTIKYSRDIEKDLNPIKIQSTKIIRDINSINLQEENEYESFSEKELIYKIKYELNKKDQQKAKEILLKKFNKKI